jgi:outer membrane lipoprotein-sorting protein
VIGFIVFGIWLLKSLTGLSPTSQVGVPVSVEGQTQNSLIHMESPAGRKIDHAGREALQKMLVAYRDLSAYYEQTQIHVRLSDGRGTHEDIIDVQLAYEAPNRLRFTISRPDHKITVASNGVQLRTRIQDPSTHDFDGQFVERPAPRVINVATLFSATEYADPTRPHELFSALLGTPVDLMVSPLGMLTDDDALRALFNQASKIVRMKDETLQGNPCAVVRVTSHTGEYTFWIDEKIHMLRRLEHPATRLIGRDNGPAPVSTATIISKHVSEPDALFDSREFELDRPAGAKIVRHFVLPPQDQDVGILNRQVPLFNFTDLQGAPFASHRWEGRHAVLIWFNDHPACRSMLTSLLPVFEKYENDKRLFFCAICTEPSTAMGHQDVRNLALKWGIPITVVRDLEAIGRDIFAVQQAPTLIVTAPHPETNRDTVQLVEIGSHPDLSVQLPAVIDKLLGGEDVAGNYVSFVEKRRREYERHLAAAGVNMPTTDVVPPATEIAPASAPARFELARLWELRELNEPGNITVSRDQQGQPVLLVHNGWHEVVTVSDDGRIIDRHEFGDDVGMSRLRSRRGADGQEFFVGATSLGRHCHVFDSQWRRLLKYPAAAKSHLGIQDVLLTDLDADGARELYVCFAAGGGVERVDLNGKQVWSISQLNSALSLTAVDTDRGRQLLVTTAEGNLIPIDATGGLGQSFSVGSRAIHHLFAGATRAAAATWYCGLTYNVNGNLIVVGLDDRLNERWNYPLPPGSFDSQVRVVDTAQLISGRDWQWLLAGPDGSIHIVSPDGTFHDHFNCGNALRGLAGFRVADAHVLVVATEKALTAWRVKNK